MYIGITIRNVSQS